METIENTKITREKWSQRNKPSTLSLSVWSKKELLWICTNGHEYKSRPEYIYKNSRQCPYCSGRLPSPENNLEKILPKLAKEWDYDKNSLLPSEVSPRSGKNFYWKCKLGHSWSASPHNRSTEQGCPYCNNKKVNDDNCFEKDYKHNHLLKEWDYDKNKILPSEIVSGSTKRVCWKCQSGHSWITTIKTRTQHGANCPFCNKIELNDGEIFDSYVEAEYYLKLKKEGTKFIRQKRYPNSKMRCDFYLVDSKTYVELTSYTRNEPYNGKIANYIKYLRKIVKKRNISKECGAGFTFIQKILTSKERKEITKIRIQR